MKLKSFNPCMKASFLLISLLIPFIALLLWTTMNMSSYMFEWTIMSLKMVNIKLPMVMDTMSLSFSATVLLISTSVMLFSTSYMITTHPKNLNYFVIMVLLFILSMNFLILSPSLLTLILGWDGLGLTSYLLVVYYLNDKSLSAGILTAMTNRIGDALLIIAVSWAFIAGHWDFSFFTHSFNLLIMISIIFTAMTKSAQFPFSAWLPAAMAAPTPVSALVHSSTLVTAGVYLLIRMSPSLIYYKELSIILFMVGSLTCIMASLSAIFENDLKKIIALSTLSQLGVMMMSIGMLQPSLAFIHLISHALFKALLFICAGTIIHLNLNNQDIRAMGNLMFISPITVVMFNVSNMSLCGFPFLAGFYSKDAIIEHFYMSSHSILPSVIFMISVCMSAAYSMRLSITTLWAPLKGVTTSQYCSKFTYCSFILLIMGAIMGGALLLWTLNPVATLVVLPPLMKSSPLMMIFLFGGYFFIFNNSMSLTSMFNNSMWFLTHITSKPNLDFAMQLSDCASYGEYTWMEKLSGKGAMTTLQAKSSSLQPSMMMSYSMMMSMMMIGMLMLLMMIK